MSAEYTVLEEDQLQQIAVKVATGLRNHPELEGGVSVRATISFLDTLSAMSLLDGAISIQTIYDAAFSAFGGRVRPKGWRKAEDIVKEVLDEVLFGKKRTSSGMELGAKTLDEELMKNLRGMARDLMKLSVAHKYGPNVKGEAKAGVYPKDLSKLLDSGEAESSLPNLTETLRNTVRQSMQREARDSSEAINDFLESLEKLNLMRRDAAQDRHKFTRGAVSLVGEKTAKETLKDHFEELVDKDSGEDFGESLSKEELTKLLNELQALSDFMRSSRLLPPVEALMHFYKNQFPTLSKILSELAPTMGQQLKDQSEPQSNLSKALAALIEALVKAKYLEDSPYDLELSDKAYELIFEDVLPEVERALARGEHDALSGSRGEGEIEDIAKYRRGDRFRDIAVGATIRELVKHHRRQPEVEDLRVNQLIPKRSLTITLAIDSSRSMAPHGKLLHAKKAAVGLALAAARKSDRVGVVAFSDLARGILDPTEDVNRWFLKRVSALRPLNSTNVEDALKKSAEVLRRQEDGSQKHIILVTDGVPTSCLSLFNAPAHPRFSYYYGQYSRDVSVNAAYVQARRCTAQDITISTICIERDEHVDKGFCLNLSRLGKGQAYFLNDERDLTQTALREYRRVKYA